VVVEIAGADLDSRRDMVGRDSPGSLFIEQC
jgi:hypothetical protein